MSLTLDLFAPACIVEWMNELKIDTGRTDSTLKSHVTDQLCDVNGRSVTFTSLIRQDTIGSAQCF